MKPVDPTQKASLFSVGFAAPQSDFPEPFGNHSPNYRCDLIRAPSTP